MAFLTDEQLQHFLDVLSRRDLELRAGARAQRDAEVASDQAGPHEVNDAVDDADQRLLAGLDHVQLLRDQEELRSIGEARERIREGRYGLCEECEKAIPLARLEVQPTAKYCIVHQAEWETQHPVVPPFAP